jgi:IclR family transcriptional regulator, acetate operon repressor
MIDVTPRENGSQSIAAVDRALDVLLLFGRAARMGHSGRTDLGVTEVSGELGLSKAAVHRILTSLRSRDLVVVDDRTRRYSLGPSALGLGRAYVAGLDVRSMAAEELAWLSNRSQETASLSIRVGDARIYVDQVVPDREVRMEVPLGLPYPLHAGAASKAFLAFFTEKELDRYLSENGLPAVTEATITDGDRLRSDLEETRSRGFATSAGERIAGTTSVAAPVLDPDARPVAVVCVSGPSERFTAGVGDCSRLVLEASHRLSTRMGHVV